MPYKDVGDFIVGTGFIVSERSTLANNVIKEVDKSGSRIGFRYSLEDGKIYIKGSLSNESASFHISKIRNESKTNALQILQKIFQIMESDLKQCAGVNRIYTSCALPLVYFATHFLGFKAVGYSEEQIKQIIQKNKGKKVGKIATEVIPLEKEI